MWLTRVESVQARITYAMKNMDNIELLIYKILMYRNAGKCYYSMG